MFKISYSEKVKTLINFENIYFEGLVIDWVFGTVRKLLLRSKILRPLSPSKAPVSTLCSLLNDILMLVMLAPAKVPFLRTMTLL